MRTRVAEAGPHATGRLETKKAGALFAAWFASGDDLRTASGQCQTTIRPTSLLV